MVNIEYTDEKQEFHYAHNLDPEPDTSSFKLHNHNDQYEILIFLQGNCQFRVEGTVYYMRPGDIVIAQSTEMHMMFHNRPLAPYERVVITVQNRFFIRNGCEDFKTIFTSRPLGVNNLMSAELVRRHQILEIVQSMDGYLKENDPALGIVMRSKLIELLYNLNRISVKSEKRSFYNAHVKDILLYINDHITANLSLDAIAGHFFINKYHLCHMFKQQTGLTVNQYITYKRILLVRELYAKGISLTEASVEAGFGNYSNFYKMYCRETGRSPKSDLVRT